MAVSLFWIGAPYLLMGFTHEYWLLLTCAALVGIGNNLWHPTAIPLLAQRYPERKGLVVSIHGMGGNVGDALGAARRRRAACGADLAPGRDHQRDPRHRDVGACCSSCSAGRCDRSAPPRLPAPPPKRSLRDILRDFKPLLANRTLIFLCASSVFRSMTHGGLMTFLPLYLASEIGYSPLWIGAAMAALADRRLYRDPDRRPPLRQDGPPSDHDEQHERDRRDHHRDDRRRRSRARSCSSSPSWASSSSPSARCCRPGCSTPRPPNMGGSAIGVLFAIQAVGSGIGPIICGLIADRYGLLATFYFLVATIIVANLLIFFTPLPERPPAEKHRFEGQPAE